MKRRVGRLPSVAGGLLVAYDTSILKIRAVSPRPKEHAMFYEFRQYTIKDGKRSEWVDYMEKVIIPFQVSKGMVVVGSFVDEEHEELYYWVRRFKTEKERERLYKAVYESVEWKEVISPKVGEMLDRKKIVVKRIVPTGRSVLQ